MAWRVFFIRDTPSRPALAIPTLRPVARPTQVPIFRGHAISPASELKIIFKNNELCWFFSRLAGFHPTEHLMPAFCLAQQVSKGQSRC
jgi:hypothetical protein